LQSPARWTHPPQSPSESDEKAELPLGGHARRRNHREMRSCCQSSVMARSTAVSVTSRPSWCLRSAMVVVAGFEMFIGLHGELRNLPRAGQLRAAPPVTVAPERVNWAEPAGHNKVGLTGCPRRLSLTATSSKLKTHQQSSANTEYGCASGGCVLVTRLRPQQTKAQSTKKTAAGAEKDTIQSLQSTSGRPQA